MSSNDEKFWAGVIAVPLILITGAIVWFVLSLIKGFVLTKLWAWFIVPVFELPMLKLWEAVGISMLLSYMTFSGKTFYKNHKEDNITGTILSFTLPWIVLFFGWIVHLLAG